MVQLGSKFGDTTTADTSDYIPVNSQTKEIVFHASNFIGVHRGGAGGGGATFKAVQGGMQLSLDSSNDFISDSSYGKYGMSGKGNLRGRAGTSRENESDNKLHAFGGGGGDYGQAGGLGQTFNKKTMGIPFLLGGEYDDSEGKVGGAGGKAIRVISTNANYTVGNYRGKLLSITPSLVPITDIYGLVGYFEAGNKSYNTGTTEATAGETVEKWVSTNDANVYLEQTTTDNKPTLQDADKEDQTVGAGISLTRSAKVTVRHAFFNNQKYIYFSPTVKY